jgi:hypothetical protein
MWNRLFGGDKDEKKASSAQQTQQQEVSQPIQKRAPTVKSTLSLAT